MILRAAVPLAILAGCQTLTMLTGGIDLSVGAVGVDVRVRRRLAGRRPGASSSAIVSRSSSRRWSGLVNGIGVGVFRVHPLIMTLGMSLVVLGLANVWQIADGPDRRRASRPSSAGSGRKHSRPGCRASQPARVRAAGVLILFGLRRTGYGRLLYAIGDNPVAARLSGARSWQVLIVLYVISAVMAGIAGFLYLGAHERRQRLARGHRRCCRRSRRP